MDIGYVMGKDDEDWVKKYMTIKSLFTHLTSKKDLIG